MTEEDSNRGSRPVYECIMCGQCCYGEGGIFITEADAAAIAAYLNIEPAEFMDRYTARRYGRLEISTREDGACHFLTDQVCGIHPVKPENCRRWPFMPGALKEEWGFLSMRNNCPGFDPQATWEEFLAFYKEVTSGRDQD